MSASSTLPALALAFLVGGCHHSVASSGDGDGGGGGKDDAGMGDLLASSGDAATTPFDAAFNGVISITIRDFKFYDATDPNTNPDFENEEGDDPDIVTSTLGADHKPVYKNGTGTTATTHGATFFNEWYNDTPNLNIHVDYPLQLVQQSDGSYAYQNEAFFPIDDGSAYQTAFGNQGEPHNYSFTAESHNSFVYNGGETFHYTGDDDVFVYIDNQLVINMGGVHTAETSDVSLDTLGLTVGQTYPLDFFFAERHTVSSDVLFQTTIGLTPVTIN